MTTISTPSGQMAIRIEGPQMHDTFWRLLSEVSAPKETRLGRSSVFDLKVSFGQSLTFSVWVEETMILWSGLVLLTVSVVAGVNFRKE